jgi:hypothetical protein
MQKIVTGICDGNSLRSPTNCVVPISSSFMNEYTENNASEEQRAVHVRVWAAPTPSHIPVLLSQLTFFQLIHECE